MLGSEEDAGKLPWTDAIIDCMGPVTKAEIGNLNIWEYICTQLKVPKVEPMMNLRQVISPGL